MLTSDFNPQECRYINKNRCNSLGQCNRALQKECLDLKKGDIKLFLSLGIATEMNSNGRTG